MLSRLALALAATTGCGSTAPDQSPEPDDGVFIDAGPSGDPFADAGTDDVDGAAAPCDDTVGDYSSCITPADGGSCLTPDVCALLPQYLQPRLAGIAMDCVNSYPPGCDSQALGTCLMGAASLACAPAPAGTPPCDVVAAQCPNGPPDAVDYCLGAAAAFTPTVASSLQSCLQTANVPCDATVLDDCAASLFAPPAGDM
ncbi:MAG TPA: hypothetical protein VFF06_24520 [Polyangia bacterium]|nr:hypothetical protein [Polyangia bacterium]